MHLLIRGLRISALSMLSTRMSYDLTTCAVGRSGGNECKILNYRRLARVFRARCEGSLVGLDLDLRSSVMALPDTDDGGLFAQVQAKPIFLPWPSITSHGFDICG
jgi:hypothetical protein